MDKIDSTKTLVKYIKYLIDYSDLISSQQDTLDNSYTSLTNEINLFHTRVQNTDFIPPNIKTELLNIKLPQVKDSYSSTNLFRFRIPSYNRFGYEEEFRNKMLKNILEFKDHLENIFDLLSAKNYTNEQP
jgi:hypothetical protein